MLKFLLRRTLYAVPSLLAAYLVFLRRDVAGD